MKKNLLLTIALFFSAFCFADEYINDNYCIYKIDVGRQTAEVLNFCREAQSITIPSAFIYQGDKYTVVGLENDDFKDKYSSEYCYYDYQKIRASIVELNLPQTISSIGSYAFRGMTRLKKVVIPEKVKEFSSSIFGHEHPRLESIIIEGLPCIEYSVGAWYDFKYQTTCLDETDNPSDIIEIVKNELKNYCGCTKLKTIEILPLKDYLLYSNRLKDTISSYEAKLKQHPYYLPANDGYFNSIKISMSNAADYKREYTKQLALCRTQFQTLYNNMEDQCKEKDPLLYAERYCSVHPEFSAEVDTKFINYKCKHTRKSLAYALLLNEDLGNNCQDSLWIEYGYLFKDKDDFLVNYNQSTDISNELETRSATYHSFVQFPSKVALQGIISRSPLESFEIAKFYREYQQMKQMGIPFSHQVIAHDAKTLKEYEKNGQYFNDSNEFFEAYITKDYKQILKQRKDSNK